MLFKCKKKLLKFERYLNACGARRKLPPRGKLLFVVLVNTRSNEYIFPLILFVRP